ncbi:Branched-chain amino acid transport system ATP-binding protein OS=Castellaniella defragrans OX=75697 GN=HNR28_000948 PE=4 SV=1 [Castellaniella defragrans]
MNILSMEDISISFGRLNALTSVSADVIEGETLAVIGPNGAGKTTFFNLISGFFPPSAGNILFRDSDITRLPPPERVKAGIARTFQTSQTFPELSVRENLRIAVLLALGLHRRLWLSHEASQQVELNVKRLIELGELEGSSNRFVGELSLSDQRVTEIMMAVARNPDLLLLDEPTAGMAVAETDLISNVIRRLRRETKITIMLIEHDMDIVFGLADRILVLVEGKVLAVGSPDEISENSAVQAAYLGKES